MEETSAAPGTSIGDLTKYFETPVLEVRTTAVIYSLELAKMRGGWPKVSDVIADAKIIEEYLNGK